MKDIPLATDILTPCKKLRERYIGPVTIVRRRRHFTFELDMGKTRLHNIYHISRLKPFDGDAVEGTPIEDETVPESLDPSAGHRRGEVFEVERVLAHRGKPGTKTFEYLIKWKGYIPQKSSWEKAEGVKAPAAIKEYNEELQRRIQYARGHTASLSKEAADAAARDTDVHLDPEAWLEADAAALSLMTEVDDRTLTMVASMWSQRHYHFDMDTCRDPAEPETDELNSTALSAVGPEATEDPFGSWYDVAEASHRRRARARDLECRLCTPGSTAGQSLSGGVSEAGGRAIAGRRGIEERRQPAASRPQRRRDQEQLD